MPLSPFHNPANALTRDDFPDPEDPTTSTRSPLSTSTSIPDTSSPSFLPLPLPVDRRSPMMTLPPSGVNRVRLEMVT